MVMRVYSSSCEYQSSVDNQLHALHRFVVTELLKQRREGGSVEAVYPEEAVGVGQEELRLCEELNVE